MNPPHPVTIKYFFLLIIKILTAGLIFFIFSLYVWLIQNAYNEEVPKHMKAILFSLTILFGGLSYDCAKKIMLMEHRLFLVFINQLAEGVVYLIAMILLCILSVTATNFEYVVAGWIAFVLAIACTIPLIVGFTSAIETASR
ncbi:hypothetical protein [Pseudomonas kunmingensis]|nr:hypothetical protein [Gammaproteobacteria bacterium]MBU0837397.1 hypothetical protein [Gammaproteobacteria bacterium]MBU1806634.1 hypothetical protein [Gammaproteobacteria bacterium]